MKGMTTEEINQALSAAGTATFICTAGDGTKHEFLSYEEARRFCRRVAGHIATRA